MWLSSWSYGLTVARETKNSISIADPDGGKISD
jgi:hypothetical protein